jgi:ABC-type Co2+ transport system permease subunit
MLITILMGLAIAVSIVLIAGIFMKKTHYVKREIIIHAPLDTVFHFLKFTNHLPSEVSCHGKVLKRAREVERKTKNAYTFFQQNPRAHERVG